MDNPTAAPLASHFVNPLHQMYDERARAHKEFIRNGVNINARLITDEEFLDELNRSLIRRENPEYCLLQRGLSYEESVEKIKSVDSNSCCLLSQFPKYINEEGGKKLIYKIFFSKKKS